MLGVCSLECAVKRAEDALEKKKRRDAIAEKRAQVADRQETRARLRAMRKLSAFEADTQAACNRYVRLRDAGKGCIDCGKPFEPNKPGGSMDAGHFRSVGSAPEMRYDLDNIFGQWKNCNRPGGTTQEAFRAGVLARIGPERLAAVEGPRGPRKWSRDELIELRARFAAMARGLERPL